MKTVLFCLALATLGCENQPTNPQEDPWILGEPVTVRSCEEWKERDPEAKC